MKNIISKNMLNELVVTYGYSTAFIAEKVGVAKKTIDRIIKNETMPSIKTEMNLINFYWFCVFNKQCGEQS